MKRLLNCCASDFRSMGPGELKQAVLASEGRTVLCEVIVSAQQVEGVTNAEVAAAFGADMILLNLYDVFAPKILGLPADCPAPIARIKELTGLPVGVNLEPVDPGADALEELAALPPGRRAGAETLSEAARQGADFVCLTGNPSTGVSNAAIEEAVGIAKERFGGLIIAGKMHGAGVNERVLDHDGIRRFCERGADVVLMPAPGTVPGVSEAELAELMAQLRGRGVLGMSAIGTSQEGADPDTVRSIALACKRAGVDIHHTGDAGLCGMTDPENIMALSVAIRGRRHTYARMARSPLR